MGRVKEENGGDSGFGEWGYAFQGEGKVRGGRKGCIVMRGKLGFGGELVSFQAERKWDVGKVKKTR